MAIIEGVVEFREEAEANKYGKCTIKVNGDYYRSKFNFPGKVGEEVRFDDMDKKWVNKLTVTGGSPTGEAPKGAAAAPSRSGGSGFPVGVTTKDRSIVRQNSLAHAARIVSAITGAEDVATADLEGIASKTVEMARVFEDYSSGDGDFREAEAALAGK